MLPPLIFSSNEVKSNFFSIDLNLAVLLDRYAGEALPLFLWHNTTLSSLRGAHKREFENSNTFRLLEDCPSSGVQETPLIFALFVSTGLSGARDESVSRFLLIIEGVFEKLLAAVLKMDSKLCSPEFFPSKKSGVR